MLVSPALETIKNVIEALVIYHAAAAVHPMGEIEHLFETEYSLWNAIWDGPNLKILYYDLKSN